MNAGANVLKVLEASVSDSGGRLGSALHDLAQAGTGLGTCLLLDHEVHGEAMIADPNWRLGLTDTKQHGDCLAVVDVREAYGFRRITVLAARAANGIAGPAASVAVALSAMNVIQVIADFNDGAIRAVVASVSRTKETDRRYNVASRDSTGSIASA